MTNRKIQVLILIAIFSFFSYFFSENALTPKWWQNASLLDVEERFALQRDARFGFNNFDKDKRTLLHLACLYSRSPLVPEFFVWHGTNIYFQDAFGYRASDYADQNPYLSDFAPKLRQLERTNYQNRLNELKKHHIGMNIDLLLQREKIDYDQLTFKKKDKKKIKKRPARSRVKRRHLKE